MFKVALIGGSGLYIPDMLENVQEDSIDTPYGQVKYSYGQIQSENVLFITRHGRGHSVPPHKVNYHANIWALKKLGVKYVISSTAVGSFNADMKVGDLVVPNQLLDFTKTRVYSFFNGENNKVVHVDVTNPYCQEVSNILVQCAQEKKLTCHPTGTYVCTEGPRFETAAEVQMYRKLGGDIVGMTGVPEAILAREAEMCYATFSLVTNLGAGISTTALSHQEVYDCMKQTNAKLTSFIARALNVLVKLDIDCECQHALKEFGGFKLDLK